MMVMVNLEEGAIESSDVVFVGKEDRWRFYAKPYRLLAERDGELGGTYEFDYAVRSIRDAMYQRIVEATPNGR